MSAIFRINQNSVDGDWGVARRDLTVVGVGGTVTLEAQDQTLASYTWELISEPEGSTAAASLNVPNPATPWIAEFDPNMTGGMNARLRVDASLATEDIGILYMGIPLTNSGLCIPAFNETFFDNSQFAVDGYAGYERKMTAFLKWVDINAGAPFPSDSIIGVSPGGSPTLNGDNLLTGYTSAKALTPGGNALAADNRATVLVPPGQYDLGSASLEVDTDFIDFKGLCEGGLEGMNWSSWVNKAEVTITSTGSPVDWTTRDAKMTGIGLHGQTASIPCLRINNPTNHADRSIFKNMSMSGDFITCWAVESDLQFHVASKFIDCYSGLYGFILGGEFSGSAYRCYAGVGSFAGFINPGGPGLAPSIFSGYAEDCISGGQSYGASWDADATFSGKAVRCTIQGPSGDGYSFGVAGEDFSGPNHAVFSGEAIDCVTSGGSSFGYAFEGNVTFSGKVTRCAAAGNSFCVTYDSGAAYTALFTGEMRDCTSEKASFCSHTTGAHLNTSLQGLMINCRAVYPAGSYGAELCFGALGYNTGRLERCYTDGRECFGNVSGTMVDCESSMAGGTGAVPISVSGGTMENCRIRTDAGSPILVYDSDSRFYGCTFYSGDGSDAMTATKGHNIRMAHCRMNSTLHALVTNVIVQGYNIVSAYVTW